MRRDQSHGLGLIWRWVTWWPVPLVFAVATLASGAISLLVEQTSPFAGSSAVVMAGPLPGWASTSDVLHSGIFLVSVLALAASVALIAIDRLLADRPLGVTWLLECLLFGGSIAVLVTVLLHVFLFREVAVPLGPGEIARVPLLDLTLKADTTGWAQETGSLAALEVAPRLAGVDLTDPFGGKDRPADARLTHDSLDVEMADGRGVDVGNGVLLVLADPPPAWAGRVTVSYDGRTDSSPFLQAGQGWTAVGLFADPALLVTADRVVPDFDPSTSIIAQSLGGPAVAPAAIITLSQDHVVVGSLALAPGDTVVMGEFVVTLDGFAPVVEVVATRGSYVRWVGASLLATLVAVAGLGVDTAVRRRLARRAADGEA